MDEKRCDCEQTKPCSSPVPEAEAEGSGHTVESQKQVSENISPNFTFWDVIEVMTYEILHCTLFQG